MCSLPWPGHGDIVVFRWPNVTADMDSLCSAILSEAGRTARLWELRLGILRIALVHGVEVEIFADNAQELSEVLHVNVRPRVSRVP